MRVGCAIVACALFVATAATAQTASVDAAAAAQFDRGLAAMNEGNLDVGCPALAESVRLDPRPGAIFTLAECEARWGRLASASAHYDDYLARFARMTPQQQRQQRDRATIASEKRADFKERVPQLLLRLPANAPSNTVVKRDGVTLGPPSLGVYLPVDPGDHELVVELPGGAKTRRMLTVAVGERAEVTLEVPHDVPSTAAAARSAGAPSRSEQAPRSAPPYGAVGAFGLGLVGVGVGTVFGLMAMSKSSVIDGHCRDVTCDHEGKSAADEAKSAALLSTIGFGVGAIGVATGALLLLVHRSVRARSSRMPTPLAVTNENGGVLGVVGRF